MSRSRAYNNRIINLFRSERNVAYLSDYLKKPIDDIVTHVNSFVKSDIVNDVIDNDNLARRGPQVEIWNEISRLNEAFVKYFTIAYVDGKSVTSGDSHDSYAMQMFTADSLRPPGLEFLNNAGPHYEILENQTELNLERDFWGRRGLVEEVVKRPIGEKKEGYTNHRNNTSRCINGACDVKPGIMNRTDRIIDILNGNATMGRLSKPPRDEKRLMRFEEIPIWQKLSHGDQERDIEETLGLGSRELDSQIRGWDFANTIKTHRMHNPDVRERTLENLQSCANKNQYEFQ